jgi:hypothetical protein
MSDTPKPLTRIQNYRGEASGNAMNWRRGLFRLWAVSSIAWIAIVFVVVNPIQKIGDPIAAAAYEDKSKLAEARAAGYSDDEIAAYLSGRELFRFGKLAAFPPLFLLAAMGGGWWVVRGFRRSPSNL